MHDEYPKIDAASFKCSQCGYDLSGSAIGGVCPECGASVQGSIRASARHYNHAGLSSSAVLSLVLGLISVTTCGFVGPFAVWLYYRVQKEVEDGLASPGSLGMAKAGMITGWIGIIIWLGFILFYAFIFLMMI